ncbi:hypothetical protein [Stenotrophomonas rhizophila]|uniref:hypothetical protein n=1 Tax=Stenotrophomonas rhizophila TaxID=216778 RepID=UPI0028AF1B71|nr:hypothetical protein [Stenotrophomonas rhizophila]
MHAYMLTVGAIALAALLVGLGRFGAWVIDRREQGATKAICDAVTVIQARAELRSLEIDATKRGDLLAAAEFADQVDRNYAIEMLDQESMGEGWS